MVEEKIVEGIQLWLQARQVGAIKGNNKELYEAMQLLLEDLTGATSRQEYPWDTIMRGLMDCQNGKHEHDGPSRPNLRLIK